MFYNHPEIIKTNKLLGDINRLVSPTKLLESASEYIPKRLGETLEVYSHRLKGLSVTPTFSTTLGLLVGRIRSSELIALRGNVTLPTESSRELLNNLGLESLKTAIASHLLKYGRVLVAVNPLDGDKPPESIATVLDPTTLINRSQSEDFYVLSHQMYESTSPFNPVELKRYYTAYYGDRIETYSDDFKLIERVNTERQRLKLYTNTENWLGELAHPLAIALFRIDSALLEACSNMYIQRTLEIGGDDPFSFEPTTNNQHVIQGKFNFVESTGNVVSALKAIRDEISSSIKRVAGLDRNTEGTNLVSSGLSKQLDELRTNQILMSLGANTVDIINDILLRLGLPLSVGGLDNYDSTGILEMIDIATRIESLRPGSPKVDELIALLEL